MSRKPVLGVGLTALTAAPPVLIRFALRHFRSISTAFALGFLLTEIHRPPVQAQDLAGVSLSGEHRRRLVRLLRDVEKSQLDQLPDDSKRQVNELGENKGNSVDLDNNQVKALAQLLRDYLASPGVFSNDARYILIEFGDTNEIKSVVTELLGRRTWANLEIEAGLELSRQPRLIAELGPLLAREESSETRIINHEMRVYPPSVGAAHVIAAVLANSTAFDASIHTWAAEVRNLRTEPKRAIFRVWCQKNEVHFANGDYSLVRPLPAKDFVIKTSDFLSPAGSKIE